MDSENFKHWFYEKFDSNVNQVMFETLENGVVKKKSVKLKRHAVIGVLITDSAVWVVDNTMFALDGFNCFSWSNKHLINSYDDDEIATILKELQFVFECISEPNLHSSKAVAENEATGLKNGLHDKDTMESSADSTKNVPLS